MVLRGLELGDRSALEGLLSEINEYYYGVPRTPETCAAIALDLLDGRYTDTVLAWDGDRAVGLAIYTFLQPTQKSGGTLFLKELFVSAQARNQGLGRTIMAWLTEVARDKGCSRFDWTAQRAQVDTIRFYQSIGAEEQPGKVYFRVTDDGFDALLARLSDPQKPAD